MTRQRREKRHAEVAPSSEVIAECIVDAGYGTSIYVEETNECFWESYASIHEVISNPEYWKQYDENLSDALNHDFALGFNFDRFRLRVYRDGRREAEKIPRPRGNDHEPGIRNSSRQLRTRR